MTTTTAKAKAPRMTAKLRNEIVAKRESGVTLAELRKQYPQFSSEQIREVLPVGKPRTRKPAPVDEPTAPPASLTDETSGYSGSGATNHEAEAMTAPRKRQRKPKPAPKVETPKAKAPKAERKPIDGKLAQRAVTMRAKLSDSGKPASWAKIGYALKLVPEGAPKSQAGDAARRAYRQVRGENAPTGPSDY